MKILLACSEVHPYSKSGGLADMVGALGKFLARAGNRVGIVTPLYSGILEKFPGIKKMDWQLDLPMGDLWIHGEIWTLEPSENLTIYFVRQPEFYFRSGLYEENNISFADNDRRFIFFSKVAAHLARYLPWKPDIVHVHDWQAGFVPLFVLHQRVTGGWFDAPKTFLTIHNLAYQGVFSKAAYALTNLPLNYLTTEGVEFYDQVNCLKTGIIFSDALTTVSPRYAREITTEQFGCALDGVLRKRQNVLTGILNGVDYDEWRTEKNPFLPHAYSADNLAGKAADKAALQKEFGLSVDANIPLFGTVSRLADQKGMDLELAALEEMLSANLQFILLGSGSPEFEKGFGKLARRYPKKAAIHIGFNQGMSHRVEAGCDFFLMPSRFEPCGLNQMYSLRYGTLPIVRTTGGLDDSVTDILESVERADGIKFRECSARALAKSIRKALVLFEDKKLLAHYIHNAMTKDFSWERTAREYESYFRLFTDARKRQD